MQFSVAFLLSTGKPLCMLMLDKNTADPDAKHCGELRRMAGEAKYIQYRMTPTIPVNSVHKHRETGGEPVLLNVLNFDHPLFKNGCFTPGRLSKTIHRITGLDICKWIASCTVVEVILWEHIDNGSFISYSHLQTQPEEWKMRCSYSLYMLKTTVVTWQYTSSCYLTHQFSLFTFAYICHLYTNELRKTLG